MQALIGASQAFVLPSTSPTTTGAACGVCASRPARHARRDSSTVGRASLPVLRAGPGLDIAPALLHQVAQGLADASEVASNLASSGADTAAAAAAADNGGGVFAGLVTLTESAITGIHTLLNGVGIEYSYGIAIIAFTLAVKALTFPLTYQQLASTTKMQLVQPKMKEIQKKYANDPEQANKAIAELYKTEEINPLSGCLPTLAQIPIFISLYRALLNLAKEGKLNEPFLWLPSLDGPVFGASPADSLNWIKVWENGVPKLGWHDTLAYLTIPVILVITQSVSQQLMQPPKKPGQENDSSQAILKFLPLLIGWFSLNVPSGLGVYWIINNFISTASSVFIRNQLTPAAVASTSNSSSNSSPSSGTGFTSGTNSSSSSSSGPKTSNMNGVIDTEAVDVTPKLQQSNGIKLEDGKGFGQAEDQDVEGEVITSSGSSAKPKKAAASKKKRSKKRN